MARLWEAKSWRWITDRERRRERKQRDGSFPSRYWSSAKITPLPRGTRVPRGWWVEVELYNGQRVFYRAY